jgi:hypothetical protein
VAPEREQGIAARAPGPALELGRLHCR